MVARAVASIDPGSKVFFSRTLDEDGNGKLVYVVLGRPGKRPEWGTLLRIRGSGLKGEWTECEAVWSSEGSASGNVWPPYTFDK